MAMSSGATAGAGSATLEAVSELTTRIAECVDELDDLEVGSWNQPRYFGWRQRSS